MCNLLVSIIVPCYKVEQYLQECVNGLISQTYRNIEIILVDDGSPDKCGELCDEYSSRDNRIVVIHKKNGGLSDARNVALNICKGDYILFIDSDDVVAPEHVELLMHYAIESNADIVVSSFSCFVDNVPSSVSKNISWKNCLCDKYEALEKMLYQRCSDVCAWGKLYKRHLFSHLRYPCDLLFEDLDTTFKLFLCSKTIFFSNDISYYYRQRPGSIMNASDAEKMCKSILFITADFKKNEEILKPVAKAVRYKLTSFYFLILIKMPSFSIHSEKVVSLIKANRIYVLTDEHARSDVRIACLFSYLGEFGVRFWYRVFYKLLLPVIIFFKKKI